MISKEDKIKLIRRIASGYPDPSILQGMFDDQGEVKEDAHTRGDSIALYLASSIEESISEGECDKDFDRDICMDEMVRCIDFAIEDLQAVKDRLYEL